MTGFDLSEVKALAVQLDEAGAKVLPEVREVIQKGALNIKRDAQARVTGLAHVPYAPAAITYDTKIGPGGVEAEIGYDKAHRGGAIGNILEYGTSKNAPIPALGPAMQKEAPITEKFIAEIAAKGLGL